MIMSQITIFKLDKNNNIFTITLKERRETDNENQFNKYERESKNR